ncbi:unnamed protein product [Allacma fusca]|uniref:Uncharacterized protein n=1 Tax=Allacma fusca TaxID=39272 RepID=A0A8J2J0E7_9HEXA|nr:unnamed protein product [Allacma fusca]
MLCFSRRVNWSLRGIRFKQGFFITGILGSKPPFCLLLTCRKKKKSIIITTSHAKFEGNRELGDQLPRVLSFPKTRTL